jgi:DNA invertase Pin-like site-specific DNA recombinase
MIDKGRQRFPLGTSQWNAKVTPEIVRAIRKRREEGASYRRLVDGFGMSQTQISRIVRGESWRWLS